MTPSPLPFPLTIVVAGPLEREQVERIGRFDPARFRVVHEPALLPTPRYVADHTGAPRTYTDAERRRWDEILAGADILFDFDPQDPASLPRRAPKLRWVQATSAGIGEFLERTGLRTADIAFTTAAGVHARPLAEFALLGLLHFMRDVPHLQAVKAAHHWERYTVRGLDGARVLVIGLGEVGREVASRCSRFGMEVWGTRRGATSPAPEGVTRLLARSDLLGALPRVDALVLACPLTADTRLMIDEPELAALKPGAVLVNVARGGVVNEPALVAALRDGRLRGAALDVFATEPLPSDSPIWDLPNVILSPHSASTVEAENGRIVDIFLDNLGRLTRGEPFRNRYEPDRGY